VKEDVHGKLYLGLAWRKQHSTWRRVFHQQTEIKLKEENSKLLHLEQGVL
jgi:hypothetical protein